METRPSPTELSVRVGISKGYASDMLQGKKTPSDTMALKVFRATGLKLGPVANLDDAEIAVLEKMRAA